MCCVHSSSTQSGKTKDKSTSMPSQKKEEGEKEGEEKEGEREVETVETVGPSQEDYDKLQEGQQVTAVYKLHCSKTLAHRQ